MKIHSVDPAANTATRTCKCCNRLRPLSQFPIGVRPEDGVPGRSQRCLFCRQGPGVRLTQRLMMGRKQSPCNTCRIIGE